MDSLRTAFFENPFSVYVILGIAEMVFFVGWYYRRSKRHLKLLAVPLLLAAAVFAVERLVETDREIIRRNSRTIAAHVEAGEYRQVLRYIHPTYRGYQSDYDDLEEFLRNDRRVQKLKSVRIGSSDIEVAGKQATMVVQTVIELGPPYSGKYGLIWKVFWIKTPEGQWRIEEVSNPRQSIPGLGM